MQYRKVVSSLASAILNLSEQLIKSFTSGLPEVRVPVLSKTIVSMCWIFSRTSAPLIRIPMEAAIPVPTMTAVGVARPSAHGQAMTTVEIPKSNAN